MPKNPALKKAARAYAAEHNVAYVEALRTVTELPEHVRAVTAALSGVAVGDRIRFTPGAQRVWWTVRARDDRFIVATSPVPFQPKGSLYYTVVDLTGWLKKKYNGCGNGVVRSSLNTLGGSWDLGEEGKGADAVIRGLRSGGWELSYRRVADVRSVIVTGPAPDTKQA